MKENLNLLQHSRSTTIIFHKKFEMSIFRAVRFAVCFGCVSRIKKGRFQELLNLHLVSLFLIWRTMTGALLR